MRRSHTIWYDTRGVIVPEGDIMLDFAIDLAHQAGALLRAGLERERTIESKGYADVVSDIDRASEALIIDAIRRRYPHHSIVAEEGSAVEGVEYTWLIDPLDGTLNYIHGFPFYCVSIAALRSAANELEIGVVYDPFRGELFSARRGQGAFCNGRRLTVSATPVLKAALLTTGFPYDRGENPANNLAEFARVLMQVQDVRRAGSAALDLCYAADGRSDGHWELGLKPWDTAAGALMLLEAGGTLTDWAGQPWLPGNPHLVATNGLIHQELLTILHNGNTVTR